MSHVLLILVIGIYYFLLLYLFGDNKINIMKLKDILIIIAAIVVVFLVPMGIHFSEVADKPFFWKGWIVVSIVCGLSFGAWWAFNWFTKKGK